MPQLPPPKMQKVKSPIHEEQKRRGHGPGGPHTPGAKAKRNKHNDFDHSKTTKRKK